MAFKMKGFSAFTKTDPPKKQKEIKNYIKDNMGSMSDKELMTALDKKFKPDGKTEYNWNPKTGDVESHNKHARKTEGTRTRQWMRRQSNKLGEKLSLSNEDIKREKETRGKFKDFSEKKGKGYGQDELKYLKNK